MKARTHVLFRHCAGFGVTIACAWLLKRHYSQASVEELRWILAPTASLVSWLLQSELSFRPGEGYLSRELSILISPACAGVNFMIVAFLSLSLGFGRQFTTLQARCGWLAGAAAVAYVATLIVNVVRIAASVSLAHLATRTFGLTFQSVHRLLGVLIYLAGLIVLCLTVQALLPRSCPRRGADAPAAMGARRVLLLALGCYLTITLLIPLLRGASASPDFWSHAAPVSGLVGALAALLFATGGRTWDDGWHEFRSSEHPQPEPIAHQPVARG